VEVVEGAACDADAGAASIITTNYSWIHPFLDAGHFKTNHAKALAKVFTTKVGYTGPCQTHGKVVHARVDEG
jgi:hypothetical protein